jgi:hypothetical protein
MRGAWGAGGSGADLAAMMAATAGLGNLQQALADRRLQAEIENIGHEWRAVLAVGRLAAIVWLAQALVDLAGVLYDAGTQSAPGHATRIDPDLGALIAALLAPVEDLLAEGTAALADPNRRPFLARPLRVGPGGEIAGGEPPSPVRGFYARALATGARRLHTAAAATLAANAAAVAKSPAPEWLRDGLQRLDGELRAAGARLEMAEVRLAALADPRNSSAGLASICRDLWTIVGAAVVAGQMSADPHLLPGSRASSPLGSAPSFQANSTATAGKQSAPPSRPAPAMPLPQIEEGAETPDAAQRQVGPTQRSPLPGDEPAPAEPTLPVVGEGAYAAPTTSPTPGPAAGVTFPAVGESEPPLGTPSAPEAAAVGGDESGIGTLGTRRPAAAAKSDDDPDEAATLFPTIG